MGKGNLRMLWTMYRDCVGREGARSGAAHYGRKAMRNALAIEILERAERKLVFARVPSC